MSLVLKLRHYLAFANIVGDFAARRVTQDHPDTPFLNPGGFIVADGEIDFTKSSNEHVFRLGTTIMTLPVEGLASLEYFLGDS